MLPHSSVHQTPRQATHRPGVRPASNPELASLNPHRRLIAVACLVVGLLGCDLSPNAPIRRDRVIHEMSVHRREVNEFFRAFPSSSASVPFVEQHTNRERSGEFLLLNSTLHRRYQIGMVVRVDADDDGYVRAYSDPVFLLREVLKVDGNAASYLDHGPFDAADWRRLVESDWDFGVWGLSIEETPLDGFSTDMLPALAIHDGGQGTELKHRVAE